MRTWLVGCPYFRFMLDTNDKGDEIKKIHDGPLQLPNFIYLDDLIQHIKSEYGSCSYYEMTV